MQTLIAHEPRPCPKPRSASRWSAWPMSKPRRCAERVRSALIDSGLTFPSNKRITVNLAPADLRKDLVRFDLPIAVGILAASGQIDACRLEAGSSLANCHCRANCGRCAAHSRPVWRCTSSASRCDRFCPRLRCLRATCWMCSRPSCSKLRAARSRPRPAGSAQLWTSPSSVDIFQLPFRSCSNASALSCIHL